MIGRYDEAAATAEFNRLIEVLEELPPASGVRLDCVLRHIEDFCLVPKRLGEMLDLLNPSEQFCFLMECKVSKKSITHLTRHLANLIFRARFAEEYKRCVTGKNLVEMAMLLVPEELKQFFSVELQQFLGSRYAFILSHINKVNPNNFANVINILPTYRQEKFIEDNGKHITADNVADIIEFISPARLDNFLEKYASFINATNLLRIAASTAISLEWLSRLMCQTEISHSVTLIPAVKKPIELSSGDFKIAPPFELGAHQGYFYCRFQFGKHQQFLPFYLQPIIPAPTTNCPSL